MPGDLLRVQHDPPVDLFVRETAGEPGRPALVFLHGFPESSAAWDWYLDYFGGRGYHCVAPDLRGYGRSSKPHALSAYTIDRLVSDVDVLIEHLRKSTDRVFVIGHDWGGVIAWAYGARRAHNLAGLVVLNAPHRAAAAASLRADRALRLRQLFRSWYVFYFQLPWLPELTLRAFDFWLVEHALRSSAIREDVFTESYIDRCKASLRIPGALTAALNYYRANAIRRFGRDFLQRRAPAAESAATDIRALLVWGALDRALDRGLIQDVGRFFPRGLEVRVYEDASHWIAHEHRDRVAADIETFIEAG